MSKTQEKKKTIVFAGGGSGGHILPLIFIWERIKEKYDTVFICEYNGKEESILKQYNLKYYGVMSGKWRRYFSLLNFVDLFKVPIGIWQSFWLLRKIKPSLVLAKGGYVSVPVAIAAWSLGIKVIAHESDAVMGLANRLIEGIAQKIAVAYPIGNYNSKYEQKMIWAGMPVRKWKVDFQHIEKSLDHFQINNGLPVIFVTGGSQGAVNLNNYLIKYVGEILEYANVVHQTGKLDFQRIIKVKNDLKNRKGKYLVYDYIFEEYDDIFAAADLIIARSGSTLADISNLAKPSVLVPLPTSASNHQYYNARSFEDIGASIVVEEREFGKINLALLIKSLLEDEERLEEMRGAAATAMKTEGSAEIMADLIDSLIG